MEQTELKCAALTVGIWRREHSGRPMADMPVELQRSVVKLLESHSWDEVCEAVGIGKSSLSILRKRHREHLQLRPRMVAPKRAPAPRRKARSTTGRKKTKVRLAQVVRLPATPKDTDGADGAVTRDGRIIVDLGGVRVGVLDGFSPSTLGAVLDVLEVRRRGELR